MKAEVPLCRRCCFCIPLRYGLLVWGYFALLSNALHLITEVYTIYYIIEMYQNLSAIDCALELGSFLANIGSFALTILLIVASHKKDAHLLKIFCTYGLVAVALNALLMITAFALDVVTYLENDYMWWQLFLQFLLISIAVGVQLYIIALVRSEIFKLENNSRFEFRNIATEAECSYYGPNDKPKDRVDIILK